MNPVAIILIISFLILLNAFFASIEIALVSLSENRINLEIKKGVTKALKIKKIKEKPTIFLSVIQVVIHIITFFQGSILKDNIAPWKLWQQYLIQLIVIFLSIIFGEILPKRISLISPLKTVYLLSDLFYLISFLIKPIVIFLNTISNIFLFILGVDQNKKNDVFAEEELRFLLNSSYHKGIINRIENNMIQNIFDFDGTVVSEIMRHRKEIVAIKSNITQQELINFIFKEKYTRFPVYEDNIDKIIGIVHVKDIFKNLLKKINEDNKKNNTKNNNNQKINILENNNVVLNKEFDIKTFIRKAYYVLEFKNISELFKEMQLKQIHIAIVIDEYGGTSGIVTIEDVIEEILGDIKDEYDNKQNVDISKISDEEYIAKGTAHLYEIEENIKTNLPTDDYDTLSGFMLGQLKRIPESNEKIKIVYKNWQFDGLTHNGLVITKVKITKIKNNDILTLAKVKK
ncbi:MAG: putative hymolysin [Candidatus Phytoplasma cynodontis]|uniref:hemolysin family protein n=1 Tax='Cynodon dactylon' phytoplasma TaxID=295320 RepID=UPI001265BD98|nr:hemolysin family protein ['Cynodon dactylon' phytoplasma]KAB8121954.1 HlyC/CorC family transporter ['Cynodon dactylon' phytoplasma]WIA07636.1 MAG: putative hymolysin [Candidatus Phytoplasma cynodontis]